MAEHITSSFISSLSEIARQRIAASYKNHYNEELVNSAVLPLLHQIRHDTKALREVNFKTACDAFESWGRIKPEFIGTQLSMDDLKTIRDHSRLAINDVPDQCDRLTAISMFIHSSYHYAVLSSSVSHGTVTEATLRQAWIEGKSRAQQLFHQYISDFKSLETAAREECKRTAFGRAFQSKGTRRRLLLQFCTLGSSIYSLNPHACNKDHPRFPIIEKAVRKLLTKDDISMQAPCLPILEKPFCLGTIQAHSSAVRCGHSDYVLCCDVYDNDQRVVSGSSDNTVKVWDLRTGRLTGTFVGHSSAVKCCDEFDNGERVISGSDDNSLKVWNLSTGQCLQTLTGHSSAVGYSKSILCCHVFDNGQRVMSGSDDSTLKVWDLKMGRCTQTLAGHSSAVMCCRVFGDGNGQRVVSGSYDNTLKVWDLGTAECRQTLGGQSSAVLCCDVCDNNGRRVVNGSLTRL